MFHAVSVASRRWQVVSMQFAVHSNAGSCCSLTSSVVFRLSSRKPRMCFNAGDCFW